MPDLIVSTLGRKRLLDLSVRVDVFPRPVWTIHLFKNNVEPDGDWQITDLVEADYPGYTWQTLNPSTWTAPTLVGRVAVSLYGTDFLAFPATSGNQTIYGYWVFDDTANIPLWCQRFDSSQTVTSSAPALVYPVITGTSQYDPP